MTQKSIGSFPIEWNPTQKKGKTQTYPKKQVNMFEIKPKWRWRERERYSLYLFFVCLFCRSVGWLLFDVWMNTARSEAQGSDKVGDVRGWAPTPQRFDTNTLEAAKATRWKTQWRSLKHLASRCQNIPVKSCKIHVSQGRTIPSLLKGLFI